MNVTDKVNYRLVFHRKLIPTSMIMKSHPRTSIILILAFSFAVSGLSYSQPETHPAEAKKQPYELAISKAKSAHYHQLETLSYQYTSALENSATELQKQGDLDALLAVKSEIERFNDKGLVPAKNEDGTHSSVIKLRKIYNDSRAKADAAKDQTIAELTNQYLAYLEELQKKLTQDGQLEQALLVKAEVTQIHAVKAGLPATNPSTPLANKSNPSNPTNSNINNSSLLLKWDSRRPGDLLGSDNRATHGYKFKHEGGNSITNDGTLSMKGGRTTIEAINSKILTSCKASQQWSLVIHFESESLDQKGPARIFSFSQDFQTRNFTLGQENDQLILRLRTTKTGNNANIPQVNLGKIKQGELYKIALTYESEKLNFHLNGKAVPIQQISGDFSNWEECNLVLGNEWKDERPWKGEIHHFAIYSSALSEAEAIASTR